MSVSGNFSETQCLQAITSSNSTDSRDLLFAWAANLGVSVNGSQSGLDVLKQIAVHFGATNAGNFSETDCLRSIARSMGATIPGVMGGLDCLKGIASNRFPPYPPPDSEIQSLTNAQKLNLPANTPVGTRVSVTDGFVVNGAGSEIANGFYTQRGFDELAGKGEWNVSTAPTLSDSYAVQWDGNATPADDDTPGWVIFGNALSDRLYYSTEDVPYPWLVTTWLINTGSSPAPTLTHPAVQQLVAPSSAQGGVFVDVLGICYTNGTSGGKALFALLGGTDPTVTGGIKWVIDRFKIYIGDGTYTYYSLSDVATPDLASNWKNASDDSPASITVTSVSMGEINAGVTVAGAGTASISETVEADGVYPVTGNYLGRKYYDKVGQPIHYPNPTPIYMIYWSEFVFWGMANSEDAAGFIADEAPAFPWQSSWTANDSNPPAPTVTRNNVCAEANWSVVP